MSDLIKGSSVALASSSLKIVSRTWVPDAIKRLILKDLPASCYALFLKMNLVALFYQPGILACSGNETQYLWNSPEMPDLSLEI